VNIRVSEIIKICGEKISKMAKRIGISSYLNVEIYYGI
jgi:hypothetical protein